MGVLFSSFIKFILSFGAGVGVASIVDKFFPDKLPAGVTPLYPVRDTTGKINWVRIIFFLVIAAIGALLIKFIGKKLNIKILK